MKCVLRLLVCASAGMLVGVGACGTAESPAPDGAGGATNSGQGGSPSGVGGASSAVGGAAGLGGTTGRGGSAGSNGAGGATTGVGGSALPWLTVNGNKLQDPTGKTIILRGSALIDIGSLYWYGGQSAAGIRRRMDKVAAAGVQGHVVRLPVYPEIDYNTGGGATCSPLPLPGRHGPTAGCTAKIAALGGGLRRQRAEAGRRLRDQQEPVRHRRLPPDRQRHHRDVRRRRTRRSGRTSRPSSRAPATSFTNRSTSRSTPTSPGRR